MSDQLESFKKTLGKFFTDSNPKESYGHKYSAQELSNFLAPLDQGCQGETTIVQRLSCIEKNGLDLIHRFRTLKEQLDPNNAPSAAGLCTLLQQGSFSSSEISFLGLTAHGVSPRCQALAPQNIVPSCDRPARLSSQASSCIYDALRLVGERSEDVKYGVTALGPLYLTHLLAELRAAGASLSFESRECVARSGSNGIATQTSPPSTGEAGLSDPVTQSACQLLALQSLRDGTLSDWLKNHEPSGDSNLSSKLQQMDHQCDSEKAGPPLSEADQRTLQSFITIEEGDVVSPVHRNPSTTALPSESSSSPSRDIPGDANSAHPVKNAAQKAEAAKKSQIAAQAVVDLFKSQVRQEVAAPKPKPDAPPKPKDPAPAENQIASRPLRSAQETIQIARQYLLDFTDKSKPKPTFDWHTHFIETESNEPITADSQKKYDLARVRWEKTMANYRSELAKRSDLSGDKKIDWVVAHLYSDFYKDYCEKKAKLVDFMSSGCGNCEAQTKMFLAAFKDLDLDLGPGRKLAVQKFSDHVQLVIYDSIKHEVWDIRTGDSVKGVEAPLYEPEVLVQGYAKRRGQAPYDASKLLIAGMDAQFKSRPRHSTAKTNSNLDLPDSPQTYSKEQSPDEAVMKAPHPHDETKQQESQGQSGNSSDHAASSGKPSDANGKPEASPSNATNGAEGKKTGGAGRDASEIYKKIGSTTQDGNGGGTPPAIEVQDNGRAEVKLGPGGGADIFTLVHDKLASINKTGLAVGSDIAIREVPGDWYKNLRNTPTARFHKYGWASWGSTVWFGVMFRDQKDADKYNSFSNLHDQVAFLNGLTTQNFDDVFSTDLAKRVQNKMNDPEQLIKDPATFLKDYQELHKQVMAISQFDFGLDAGGDVKSIKEDLKNSQKFKDFQAVENRFYENVKKIPDSFTRLLENPSYSEAQFKAMLNGVLLNSDMISQMSEDMKGTPTALPHQEAILRSLTQAHLTYFADELSQEKRDEKIRTTGASSQQTHSPDEIVGIQPSVARSNVTNQINPEKIAGTRGNGNKEQSSQVQVAGKKKLQIIPEPAEQSAMRVSVAERLHVFEYCANFAAFLPKAKECLGQWSLPFTVSLMNSGLIDSIQNSYDMAPLVVALRETAQLQCQDKSKAGCSNAGLKTPMPPELAELLFAAAEKALETPNFDLNSAGFDSVFKAVPKSRDEVQSIRSAFRGTLK